MPIAAGGFGNDITVNVIASIIASAFLLAAGFLWEKYRNGGASEKTRGIRLLSLHHQPRQFSRI